MNGNEQDWGDSKACGAGIKKSDGCSHLGLSCHPVHSWPVHVVYLPILHAKVFGQLLGRESASLAFELEALCAEIPFDQ